MKHRIILYVAALFVATYVNAQDITLNGVPYHIDTVADYPVGPGTQYVQTCMTRISDGGGRLDVYILQVDTRNEYVALEEILGKGQLTGLERPSAMAERTTTPTHIVFSGVNGDFFASQRPVGLTIENNEYAYIGSTGRRVGGVTAEGKSIVATNWKYSGKLYTAQQDTLTIKHVNDTRNTDELVLYNKLQGATTGTNQYGTELLVELCAGEKWKTHGRQRVVVRKKEQNNGSMQIPAGQAVLSGHGVMQTALDKINTGDTLTVRFSLKLDDVPANLSQAIGGDTYALILDNGVAEQSNFWNELHPRTGYGSSMTGDTAVMCVVDGRGLSVGCTTKVLGEIMRYFGAWRAVNWDGGGSSCMYVREMGQLNNGSDGSERTVTNGMFAVANLPEDDRQVTMLRPLQQEVLLPQYGIFVPQILAYNKYGVMLSADYKDYKLECDDSTGIITDDGAFLATTTTGGLLTARAGDVICTIQIRIAAGAQPHFIADSLLLDNRHEFVIKVQTTVDDKTLSLENSAIDWLSTDEQVCTVDAAGIVKGAGNGEALVTGSVGSFTDTLFVRVENAPQSQFAIEGIANHEKWKLTASSGFNPTLETSNNSLKIHFDYSIARSPFVQLACNERLYGLPDSLKFRLKTTASLDGLIVGFHKYGARVTDISKKTLPQINAGTDSVVGIAMNEVFDTNDLTIFPIDLNNIRFSIGTSNNNGGYDIMISDMTLVYDGLEVTSLEGIRESGVQVYPNPTEGLLVVKGVTAGAMIMLTDAEGRQVMSIRTTAEDNNLMIGNLPAGVYLLQTEGINIKILKY